MCQPSYKSSFTFKGWFTKQNGKGTQVKEDSKVTITANQTLYAYWVYHKDDVTKWTVEDGEGCTDYCSCYPCPSGGGCFLAGTKIKTLIGYKDIDKIKIGEYVLTYNESTGNNEYHIVTNRLVHNPDEINDSLYTLSFDDKTTLQVTSPHRFYINRNGKNLWIAAEKLIIGDQVLYSNHKYHMITKISKSELKNTVYNLTVDTNHNYYVGNQQILVHNQKVDNTHFFS